MQKLIPSNSGKQGVVPLGEKRVLHEVKFVHLIFGDFDVGGIVIGIQSAADG